MGAAGRGRRAFTPGSVLVVMVAALLTAVTVDAASVGFVKMTLGDTATEAARNAATSIQGLPVNPDTAQVAYEAAIEVTKDRGNPTVLKNPDGDDRDFLVGPDGSVTLTVQRTAPSLVLQRVPGLAGFMEVEYTIHQDPLGY